VSVPYWAIDVSLSAGGQSFTAQWMPPDGSTDDAGRCLQQPVAQQAAQQIRAAGSAQVVSVETERVREGPPLLFDLGTLQEVCSKQLGLDVQETWTSPRPCTRRTRPRRTRARDSGYLPESMLAEVPTVLDSLLKTDPTLRPLIMGQLDRTQRSRAWNDGKVTAHHGIIPTLEPANLSAMSEKELAVYRTDPGALPGAVPAASRVRPHRGGSLCGRAFAGGRGQADRRARLAHGTARQRTGCRER
jgi:DNA topoisomerase-3